MALRHTSDEGFTLVEVVVGLAIVTVALLGLLDELAAYLHQQAAQRAHATALRIATATLEDARRLQGSLAAGNQSAPVQRNGITYTTATSVQMCSPTNQTSCASAGTGTSVARVHVTVSWNDPQGPHSLGLTSSSTDTGQSTLNGSTSGLTTDSTGASGTSITASSMSVSPTSISVDDSGNPTSNITVSIQVVGLATGTAIPITWTDDNGGHQTSATNTGGTTWSVTVPKASITRAVSSGSKTVAFSASVPGVHALQTATLTVVPQPRFSGSCTVTVAPIVLVPLTRKTSLPEIVSCTTVGLASTDSVKAVYNSGSGTANLTLTSGDGATWTGTIAAGTTMVSSGSTENFTYTLTRASDGYTKSQSGSVTLA